MAKYDSSKKWIWQYVLYADGDIGRLPSKGEFTSVSKTGPFLHFYSQIFAKALTYDKRPKMKRDAPKKQSFSEKKTAFCRASLFIFDCSSHVTSLETNF